MATIKELLNLATIALTKISPSPHLDAELLLAKLLKKNRAFLYAHSDFLLNNDQESRFQDLLEQRLAGVPIAYLIGYREFWSLPLKVNEHTLIPRPETELLVELALTLIKNPKAQVLDLGTGSGAIALACASEQPGWEIIASDVSLETLNVAKENASAFGFNNIKFCHSNWFEQLKGYPLFDAILSNPPYIGLSENEALLDKELSFEPSQALFAGKDGLDAIELIISQSLARLKPGGLLLIEHGFDQRPAIESMLIHHGYDEVRCWKDSSGHDRVSGGKVVKD